MSTKEDGDTALLLYDGLQDAFIGSIERVGQPPIACYSKRMVISVLVENYDLSESKLETDTNLSIYLVITEMQPLVF